VLDAYRQPTTPADALAESGSPSLDARCLGQAVDAEWSGDEKTYPFYFLPYYRLTHATGGPPLPNLSEVGDPLTGARWVIPAELNPITAARAGIGEGDAIVVVSPAGQIRVRARIFEGVPEDTVRMPMSRTGDSVPFEANARELLAPARSATGETPLWGVRVRLERA